MAGARSSARKRHTPPKLKDGVVMQKRSQKSVRQKNAGCRRSLDVPAVVQNVDAPEIDVSADTSLALVQSNSFATGDVVSPDDPASAVNAVSKNSAVVIYGSNEAHCCPTFELLPDSNSQLPDSNSQLSIGPVEPSFISGSTSTGIALIDSSAKFHDSSVGLMSVVCDEPESRFHNAECTIGDLTRSVGCSVTISSATDPISTTVARGLSFDSDNPVTLHSENDIPSTGTIVAESADGSVVTNPANSDLVLDGVCNTEQSIEYVEPVGDSSFLNHEELEFQQLMKNEFNPSAANERWARNRFAAWRKENGMDPSVRLEDIPLQELGQLLARFFFVACKMNKELYPAASLMNLYKSYNRILIRAQDDRVNATGVSEPRFSVMVHPFFINTNKAIQNAMKRSRAVGVGRVRRKVDALTFEQEKRILACAIHQCNTPNGVHKRWAFYCFVVFLVRGHSELYNLRFGDFKHGFDSIGLPYVV